MRHTLLLILILGCGGQADDTAASDTDTATDTAIGDTADTAADACVTGRTPELWMTHRGDESVNAGSETLVLSPGTAVEGIVYDALEGSDCIAAYPLQSTDLWPDEGAFTVEGWVRTDGGSGVVFRYYDCAWDCSSSQANIGLQIDDEGKPHFALRGKAGTIQSVTGTGVVDDDAWHHLAGVRTVDGTSSTLTLYVDGVEAASADQQDLLRIIDGDGETEPITLGCVIGNMDTGATNILDGQIDEVTYHLDALAPADIAALHEAGADGRCDHPQRTLPSCEDGYEWTGTDVEALPSSDEALYIGGQDTTDAYVVELTQGEDVTITTDSEASLSMSLFTIAELHATGTGSVSLTDADAGEYVLAVSGENPLSTCELYRLTRE